VEILDAVHLEDPISYTLYSSVYDLEEGTIELNFMSQFNETIHFDITVELGKGERIVEMRDLFSKETVEAGDTAYRHLNNRELRRQIGAFVALAGVLAVLLLALKRIRTSHRART